jgi:hypothetical protein
LGSLSRWIGSIIVIRLFITSVVQERNPNINLRSPSF